MLFNAERVKNFGVSTLGSKEKIWVDIAVECDAKHIARKQVKKLCLRNDPDLLCYYFFYFSGVLIYYFKNSKLY